MTTMLEASLSVLAAYLVGAIPFGLLYSLYVENDDLREEGSGNIGATNVLRNFGWFAGVLTLSLDAAKGGLPAYLAMVYFPGYPLVWILVGASAILGHVFPIYLKFDGGKGVATSAGVFGVLMPVPFAIAIGVFALVVALTRYMSAGSLLGALVLSVSGVYFYRYDHPVVVGAWVLTLLVYWRHRENIKRLVRGEEKTFL